MTKQQISDKKVKKRSKLMRSTAVVSLMTLLSRLLGFARDVILANVFGASGAFDAFIVAFKIPNFLRRIFAEGAFSQAFVPILAEYRQRNSPQEVRAFLGHVVAALASIIVVIIVLIELAAPWVVVAFAPGFHGDLDRLQLTTHLLRITFPYLLLITLIALAGAVQNTYQRFALPAATPLLLNVALISGAWWLAPRLGIPIVALAIAIIVGGIVQVLIQLPALRQLDLLPRPRFNWRHSGVRRVMRQMVPALFGVSIMQISILIDNFFASFLPAGSISWLYYSDRLTYLPLGVIGVALATVVMPHLSVQHASGSDQQFKRTVDWAQQLTLLIGLPAAVGLGVLAGPILTTLIYHGAFTWHDVLMSSKSLAAFALGLPAFMLIKVLASAFYSQQNIKTPVKVAAMALLINVGLNFALIGPLAHAGLALATAVSSWVNALTLWGLLLYQRKISWNKGCSVMLGRLLLANVALAVALYYGKGALDYWASYTVLHRSLALAKLIALAVLGYPALLGVLGVRPSQLRAPDKY